MAVGGARYAHNFRKSEILYICHCAIHNLKSLVIFLPICENAKMLVFSIYHNLMPTWHTGVAYGQK
jgi:hypothetical protein